MNSRLGVRIGGAFAMTTCALLVACGGGGGGGGGTTPSTPTPTATPVPSFQPGADAPMPAVTKLPLNGVWAPYQVASALQMPVIGGYSGVGETIAVVGDATPAPSDVAGFLAGVGLTGRAGGALRVVNVAGGPDGTGSGLGDDSEATLDVETALALAPGATVEFLAMPNTNTQSFLDVENYVLTDPLKPAVVSESFGGCEYASSAEDSLFSQAAAKGIAYTAASGDTGNECSAGNNSNVPGVNYPASNPHVIGVGGNENVKLVGTTSYSLTSLTAPIAWNDLFFSQNGQPSQGATGGGVSGNFPIPSYQATLAGVASSTRRNVPDITMPSEAVGVYYGGSWQIFGGTSWGAPQGAALVAELDEYCHGSPADAVAAFYTAYSRSSSSAFVDVTSGNNEFAAPSRPYYTATVGYDDATGLGLPLGKPMASYMCPSRSWAYVTRSAAMAEESYGAARDTDLQNAVNLRSMSDLGFRAADSATSISIVIRSTSTAPRDEQTVIAALQAAGFRITQTYPSHLLIEATAPASVVNSYFRTAIHNVYQSRYGQRYANVSSITVPAAIAPYVQGVVADNVIRKHRLSYRMR